MNKTVIVIANPVSPANLLDREDRVLDVFHSAVAVSVLDDFEFTVHTENMTSRIEPGDYDDYEFTDDRISVHRVGDLEKVVIAHPQQRRTRKP